MQKATGISSVIYDKEMKIRMTLNELEKQLGINFPKAFHRIYETGSMKWLEMSRQELKDNREAYISDTKAFLLLNCSCEPYLFCEIPKAAEELKEWISWQEQDRKVKLSDNITLIPFGRSGGGDMYCFLYREGEDEPDIIQYYHDEYGEPPIAGHDFDEFIYVQMLEAAENEEDIEGENFREHIKLLDEKYRSMIADKDADELTDDLYALIPKSADIWCKD